MKKALKESLVSNKDTITKHILKKLGANYDSLVLDDDMYPIIMNELKDLISQDILNWELKRHKESYCRDTLRSYLDSVTRYQDIANHTDEEMRDSGILCLYDEKDDDNDWIIQADGYHLECCKVGDPYLHFYVKEIRDLRDLFKIKPENIEQLTSALFKSRQKRMERHIDYGKYDDVIEESIDSGVLLNRFSEITNPEQVSDSQLHPEIDDDEYYEISQELDNVRAREEQVEEIVGGEKTLTTSGIRGQRDDIPCIRVEFQGGNDDIGYCAYFTFRNPMWELDISDCSFGNFYGDYTTQDLIQIFKIPEDIIKKYFETSDIEFRHYGKDVGILEESIDVTRPDIVAILKYFKSLGFKYAKRTRIPKEQINTVLDELTKFYDKKIVDYFYAYSILEHKYNGYFTLVDIIERLDVYTTIANHNTEEYIEKTNEVRLDNGYSISILFWDKTPVAYRTNSQDYHREQWNIKNMGALINVFNVKPENVEKMVRHMVEQTRHYREKNVQIEEALELKTKDANLKTIMKNLGIQSQFFIIKRDSKTYQEMLEACKKIFDDKIVNLLDKLYSVHESLSLSIFVDRLCILSKIASHSKEDIQKGQNWTILFLEYNDESYDCSAVRYDINDESFYIEPQWQEHDNYIYSLTANDLVSVLNISKENVSKLIESTYSGIKDFTSIKFGNNKEQLEESISDDVVDTFLKIDNIYNDKKKLSFVSKYDFSRDLSPENLELLRNDLREIYNPEIVDFAYNYLIKTYSIVIGLLFIKTCILFTYISEHTEESYMPSENRIVLSTKKGSAFVTCNIVNGFIKYHLVLYPNNYHNISPRDLIELFNVSKDNIQKITAEEYSNEAKQNRSDIIEESFNSDSIENQTIQYIIQNFKELLYPNYDKVEIKKAQPIIEYLYTIVDKKYVDFIIKWYTDRFDDDYLLNITTIVNKVFQTQKIGNHKNEEISVLEFPVIQLDSLYNVLYDMDSKDFTIEVEYNRYWYNISPKDLVEVFNVSKANIDKLVELTYKDTQEDSRRRSNDESNIEELDECSSATCAGDVAATVLPFGGIGSKYKAKKGDWKKSAEQINKEIVDNMV